MLTASYTSPTFTSNVNYWLLITVHTGDRYLSAIHLLAYVHLLQVHHSLSKAITNQVITACPSLIHNPKERAYDLPMFFAQKTYSSIQNPL